MADERDSFWDIEKLLPKTKKRHESVRFDTTGVDICDSSSDQSDARDKSELKLTGEAFSTARHREERLLFEYAPDSAFIKRASVYSQDSAFRYYEDFERTMHKYMRLTVKEAERVPYFSYVPQYSQLSAQRLSWYLYWRSGCRRRDYMQTDYSYVLLYAYELLNFANPRYPDRMIEELCSLWRAYRCDYPQLDRCMPDWVCDYCLVHRVTLPYEIISEFLDDFLPHASLREFYLGIGERAEGRYARAVIMGASGYNYKKSKYYTSENRAMYDEHILSAAAYAVGVSSEKFRGACSEQRCSIIRRDAYAGALCTSRAKRIIVVEYLPLYRSGELRVDATLAVKYAENRLRAMLGIRSRLNVTGLSERVKSAVDTYFADNLGAFALSAKAYAKEDRDTAEYMAYYDSPRAEFEFERALNLEEDSWETAALMGETFEEDEVCDQDNIDISPTESEQQPCDECEDEESADGPLGALDGLCVEVLTLIAKKKTSDAAKAAMAGGGFISDICERINEAAIDYMSDIIIECDSGEYYILEDYESEVMKWLKI